MRKLLFFASDYTIGLSAVLTDQLISISDSGIDVVAVAGENEQEKGLDAAIAEKEIDLRRIKGLDTHSNFRNLVGQIKKNVIEGNIDVIHVQNNWQLAIAYVVKNSLRFKRKVKIVYTIHGFRNNHPIKSKIAQIVIGGGLFVAADKILCMTEFLKGKFNWLSYKISMVPLGIKDDFFTDKYIAPPIDSLQIIFPAQFRPGKNQGLIIHAFKDYLEKSHDYNSKLVLPGGGDLLDEMKALVNKLGIADYVYFPGLLPKKDIRRLYLESNVAIVASNSETFGQSIVEPFVLGRCVVSTPVGIANEIIEDDVNGFIFNTKEQLLEIFIELANNKSRLITMGETNFKKRDMFRWKSITSLYRKSLEL